MSAEDPIERLVALDRALAPSSDTVERVRRRLERRAFQTPLRARLRVWPMLAFAAGAVVMALAMRPAVAPVAPAILDARAPTVPTPVPETKPVCARLETGTHPLQPAACHEADGVVVTAILPSMLDRQGSTLELMRGESMFEVKPRPHDPLRVRAGEVEIVVLGTKFIVQHDLYGGHVFLIEGRITVRMGSGDVQELGPGQQLSWSGPSEPPSPKSKVRKAPKASPPRDERELASILEEIHQLRRAKQFGRAVERLRAVEHGSWSPRAQQVLSYEIGTLLDRQLHDVAAACEHWAKHQRRFPGGRFSGPVADAMQRLACESGSRGGNFPQPRD